MNKKISEGRPQAASEKKLWERAMKQKRIVMRQW